MERRNLYQDDLTEERQPTPAQRDDVAHTTRLDPDASAAPDDEVDDEDAEDDDLDDDDAVSD